jgi:hypothetical protein
MVVAADRFTLFTDIFLYFSYLANPHLKSQ